MYEKVCTYSILIGYTCGIKVTKHLYITEARLACFFNFLIFLSFLIFLIFLICFIQHQREDGGRRTEERGERRSGLEIVVFDWFALERESNTMPPSPNASSPVE